MTPTRAELLTELRAHRVLGSAPESEHEWLLDHARYAEYAAGEPVLDGSLQVDDLVIMLSGRYAIYVDRGSGPRKVIEWRGGDVGGTLPYSRLVASPGPVVVDEAIRTLLVAKDHFPELIRVCPVCTATLVHVMLDRARAFSSSDWQDEKLMSLGRMAAGLAHELGNPSSAAARSAQQLAVALDESERAGRVLAGQALTSLQLDAMDHVHELALASTSQLFRAPLERVDREEQFTEWLASHGVDAHAGPTLADTSLELDALDTLADLLSPTELDAAIRWVAAGSLTRTLAKEVLSAVTRVHDLVAAIKRHTHMDRAGGAEAVDVSVGIGDVIAIAGSKSRQRHVAIVTSIDPTLPRVWGNVGELNQVWANLVDNALDAATARVDIKVRHDAPWVTISVVDDGEGIPPEVQLRMFDAFYTTKPVGQGTGLGLDIVQRIVGRYNGVIEVKSEPGRTEFLIRFPVTGVGESQPGQSRVSTTSST
ncbi:MAG: HAMP domain-containing sensor histidine kinase [Gemmatimonadaceae bacterium]